MSESEHKTKCHKGGEVECWLLHPEKYPYNNKDKKDEDKDKREKKPWKKVATKADTNYDDFVPQK